MATPVVENQLVTRSKELKDKYDIDPTDALQVMIMKMVKKEAGSGNTELASLLADVQKVHTVGEALAVVAGHQNALIAKAKDGTLQKEAADTATNIAKALGGVGILQTLLTAYTYLTGKSKEEALHFLMDKIHKARTDGLSADAVTDMVKAPLPGEEAAAARITAIAKARFANIPKFQQPQAAKAA